VLAAAGVEKPSTWEGGSVPAAPGKNLLPAFDKDITIPRDCLWWLHEGNRAIRAGDWKLVADKGRPWELYDLSTDRAEQHDLASRMPEKVSELAGLWQKRTDEFSDLARQTQPKRPKPQDGSAREE